MDQLKPLSGLTRLLTRMLYIYTFIVGCAILADIYWWIEYANYSSSQDVSEVYLASDMVNGVVGITQSGVYIALAVIFLKWIYRINKNLSVRSSTRMEFTPGWSIGWYFIPFANLFKPYQAMKEIWKSAHQEWAVKSSILGWWWFLWLTSSYVSRIAAKLILNADTLDGYTAATLAYLMSDGIDIALNIVALMLVLKISKAYEENYGAKEKSNDAKLIDTLIDTSASDYEKNLMGA